MQARQLLPRVVRHLRRGSLTYRVADRLERLLLVREVPAAAYADEGARLMRLGGELAYSTPVNDPLADEQRQRNLDLVVGLCRELDVEHFVVAIPSRGRTRVGVPRMHREKLLEVLVSRGAHAPLYTALRSDEGTAHGLAVRLDPEGATSATGVGVWRHVHDPLAGRHFGESLACWLEFWEELPDGRLVAPSPNERAAEVLDTARANPTEIAFRDHAYRTIPPFDRPGPFVVPFPIDMVYLWVDDRDPAWQARRQARLGRLEQVPLVASTAAERFREQDELRYSLRSVERFAPWVRNIYLVTDQQRPDWLVDEHPKLRVVDHREIFPPEALPTFNSHAITARVHHIDGLSEHFLLMNDDVLLGRQVGPERFFHANGLVKFFLSRSPIPSGPVAPGDPPHMAARKRVRDLIERDFGFTPWQTFKHTPVPMKRSHLRHLEERFADEVARTVASPFRSSDDIVPSWLHHYSAYAEGAAVPSSIRYDYFNLAWRRSFERLVSLIGAREVDCFCLNDDEVGDLELPDRMALLAAFLQVLLPRPSSYERPTSGTAVGDRSELVALLRSVSQAPG